MALKNKAIINSIGSLVLFAGQWLISVMIVKIAGYGEAGIFNLAMSISNIFSFIANYGIRNYQISDSSNEFTQTQYFWARVVTVIISFASCAVYLFITDSYSSIEKTAIIVYLFYSNTNLISDVMMGTIQLDGRLEINGYSNIIRGIVCLGVFCTVYAICHNLIIALLFMFVATTGITVLYDLKIYSKVNNNLRLHKEIDAVAIAGMLKKCFSLMMSSFFPVITTAVPRKIINDIYGEKALGYFSTIFTPTVLIITLAPALILSVIPNISELWKKKEIRKCSVMILYSYGICCAFIILAEIAAYLVGKPAMVLVYNEEILDNYNLFYWSILATGINAFTSCGNAVLIAMRKNVIVVISSFVSMLTALLLSKFFIVKFNIYGAAYILLTAYVMQALIQIAFIILTINRRKKEAYE